MAPVIGEALGCGFTVNDCVAAHVVGSVYVKIGFPDATPTTLPLLLPTVAKEVLLLLQVPPVEASLSVIAKPTQTDVGPVMATGSGFTVTVLVATAVIPFPSVTVTV